MVKSYFFVIIKNDCSMMHVHAAVMEKNKEKLFNEKNPNIIKQQNNKQKLKYQSF